MCMWRPSLEWAETHECFSERHWRELSGFRLWNIAVPTLAGACKSDPKVLEKFKDAPIVVGEKHTSWHIEYQDSPRVRISNEMGNTLLHCRQLFLGPIFDRHLRDMHAAYPIQYDCYAIGLLSLVPGIKVIITDNIAMQGGVGNGCIGTLQDINMSWTNIENNVQGACTCLYMDQPFKPLDFHQMWYLSCQNGTRSSTKSPVMQHTALVDLSSH